MEQAQRLDDHLQRTGRVVGPLHGLPVTVKDSFNIAGVDSAVGITALAFKPATSDASLVQLLRSLGAVIIAKTNVPQTMGFLDTVNHLAGRTLNPRNRRLTAGGSSGGEAVAVAMCASMVGFGTDLGGSVRIPAMCNGIYGFKPSDGRLPFGGQATGQPEGKFRVGLKPVAGLLARSIADIDAVMREIVPRSELFDSDCIPGKWQSETPSLPESISQKRLTVGVLRSDGLIAPLPPVAKVLDEVARVLKRTAGVDVVEVPTPPLMSKCQAAANRLMDVDGSGPILDLLAQTSEPLMPYLQGKMVRRPPLKIDQLYALQAHRKELENAIKQIWTTEDGRRVDAIILPVAPHPVPEIDRWGGVSYTSTFVLCDYPAGTIPVRDVTEADLEQELDDATKQPLSRSDALNRKLCMFLVNRLHHPTYSNDEESGDKSTVDRRVYLNSSLSIQVITPRLHEYDLCQAMRIIEDSIRKNGLMQNLPTPKL